LVGSDIRNEALKLSFVLKYSIIIIFDLMKIISIKDFYFFGHAWLAIFFVPFCFVFFLKTYYTL